MNELKFNEWIEEHIQYCHVLLNEEWMQIPKKGKQKNMDWIKFLWELMDFFSLRFYQNPNSILLGIFENAWKGEVIWIYSPFRPMAYVKLGSGLICDKD